MTEKARPRGYFEQSRDLTNSLILIAPLLVIYEVGLFLTAGKAMNGVDFLTLIILQRTGERGLLIFNLLLALAVTVAATMRRRERAFSADIVPLVLVESAVYAFALGIVINLILGRLRLGPPDGMPPVTAFFASLGAGVNEELFFRFGLLQVLAWALARGKKDVPEATAVAVILSSLAFSAAHGEFELHTFLFRFLAGAIFSVLFLWRGLAVAVYTHAIYDIYVLVVLALISR